ncbi:MAG: hypothetical protein HY019_18750 [Aquabacterium sp.]|uniref:type IV toxin-antitoxin system AbiEi family antitoxin domain-containing protein n=1 Tax=Aquabacterium sp. TaxID=1872578 RepID=UPI0025B82929|nr:hypothetical protein [Aquabacterium sp.]MBI3384046.1 hypothetical protein [Aquabacterium sp.]
MLASTGRKIEAVATRIQIAKSDIVGYFENELPHVLTRTDIARALREKRAFWRLAQNTTLTAFIRFLTEKTKLREVRFPFPTHPASGFVWGEVPLLQLLHDLIYESYYSHYTAMRLHGLTEQVPKTIYITQEKRSGSDIYSTHYDDFEQVAIDSAFSKAPRISTNQISYKNYRITLLAGAYRAAQGIMASRVNYGDQEDLNIKYTTIERTLIDIVVRPFYAGGVFEVAKAFENAKGRISVNKMAALYENLGFGYPYHQAIGYYLERAGYKKSVVELFEAMPMNRNFYLTHNMGKSSWVAKWHLFVPDGF